jgi:hypothetical protein
MDYDGELALTIAALFIWLGLVAASVSGAI